MAGRVFWTLVKTEMMRPLLATAGALAALALAAPQAQAACPELPLDRTFLPWLDLAYYQEAP